MKKTRWIAGAMALTLLAGCSSAADPNDLAYQTADVKRDSELLTVDGVGVPAEEYLFWLSNAIYQEKNYGGLADDSAWEETLWDGSNTTEALKADALETTKFYQVVRNKAKELGLTLSEEQQAQSQADLEDVKTQLGSDEAYQEWLDNYCISADGISALNDVYYLSLALRDRLEADGALTVTQEDLDTFMKEEGVYAAKHILISTRRINEAGTAYEELPAEEKAAAFLKAQDLRQQLRDGGDSEELFDTLMSEYSEDSRLEDGTLSSPDGYTYICQNWMVPEFEEGAMALAVGEISEPIESTYGYHIILRIEPDMEMVKSECDEDYKYDSMLQTWMDEAEVTTTKAYDELDPHDFYVRLQAVLQARQDAQDILKADESAAPSESAAN